MGLLTCTQYVANTTRDWTSARVTTMGKRSFAPAANQALKIEARVMLPMAKGAWWVALCVYSPGGHCEGGAFTGRAALAHPRLIRAYHLHLCNTCVCPVTEVTFPLKICPFTSQVYQVCPWHLYSCTRLLPPLLPSRRPAFWMLPEPSTNQYGGWCASGEIDIMEHINNDTQVYGTLHYGGGTGTNSAVNCQQSSGNTMVSTNSGWHRHAIVWSASYIAWYVDDVEYYRSLSSQWWSGGNALGSANPSAPFNEPFYVLLNLAVGGNWPGNPTATAPFSYYIDWVRVWQMPA